MCCKNPESFAARNRQGRKLPGVLFGDEADEISPFRIAAFAKLIKVQEHPRASRILQANSFSHHEQLVSLASSPPTAMYSDCANSKLHTRKLNI